jgi:hypothetical protein
VAMMGENSGDPKVLIQSFSGVRRILASIG